jgi:hypothetical protein
MAVASQRPVLAATEAMTTVEKMRIRELEPDTCGGESLYNEGIQ